MACTEGNILKFAVIDKIEEYLRAEQVDSVACNFDAYCSRVLAEAAHCALTQARRRYWQHLKLHKCDTTPILAVEPTTLKVSAV